jgi:sugar lactone lactonase YvrE
LLYWIDVRRPSLRTYDPSDSSVTTQLLDEKVGSFCERESGGLLFAMKSGLHYHDTQTHTTQPWFDPEPALPNNRLNDGKCDRQGRFWVGSMNDGDRLPTGSMYCVQPDGALCKSFDGITIPNSLAFSPDGRIMYFADTPQKTIMAYTVDPDVGVASDPRVFRDMRDHPGRPDGSTVDADGCLWNAEVHGSRVVRYTPKGDIDRIIDLPVTGVTSCGFGGARLDTLYITTARQGLNAEQLANQPLAGALFAVHTGPLGIAETPFRG